MPNLSLGQELRLRDLVRRSPVLADVPFDLQKDRVVIGDPDLRGEVTVATATDETTGELADTTKNVAHLGRGRRTEITFDTLAREAANAPVEEWAGIVDECLRRMVAAIEGPNELTGPLAEIADRIYPRIVSAGYLEGIDYATELAPGLLETLALDLPETIGFLYDDHVAQYGLERLRAHAAENVRRLAVPSEVKEVNGTYIVGGDDHTATRLFALPELITAIAGDQDLSNGVVVGVPSQRLLVFDVPTDGDLAGAMYRVSVFAKTEGEITHPISDQAFRWQDGRLSTMDDVRAGLVLDSQVLAGRAVEIDGDRIVVEGSADHEDLRLSAVQRVVADAWGGAFRADVDAHLRRALIAANGVAELAKPTSAVLPRTYPLLLAARARPDPDAWRYAREITPEVIEAYVLDPAPDTIEYFDDGQLARHGSDQVREAALHNLRDTLGRPAHWAERGVRFLEGGPYTAASALLLDEVIARTTGETELPDGAIVALPDARRLIYHVPRGPGLAVAVAHMSERLRGWRRGRPDGALSRHLFWWRDGTFHQLAVLDEGRWSGPDEFAAVYQRCCLPPATIAGLVRPRLLETSSARSVSYATVLGPGLRVVFGYDDLVLDDTEADLIGPADLAATAWHNYRADAHDLRVDEEAGTFVVRGTGNVAAGLLSRPLPVELVIEADEPPDGVLVAVSDQNTVLVRASTSAADRAALTARLHRDGPPLSVLLYRWRDGALRPADDDVYPLLVTGEAPDHARELAPGLHGILTRGDQVLDDDAIAGYGETPAWDLALHNALAGVTHTERDGVHELAGPHAAGLAAVLGAAIARVSGETPSRDGVLVTVSGQELLRYHVLTDPHRDHLRRLLCEDLPDGTAAYWCHDGTWDELPTSVPAPLAVALRELDGSPPKRLAIDFRVGDRAMTTGEMAWFGYATLLSELTSAADLGGWDTGMFPSGVYRSHTTEQDLLAAILVSPDSVAARTGERPEHGVLITVLFDQATVLFLPRSGDDESINLEAGKLAHAVLAELPEAEHDVGQRLYLLRDAALEPLGLIRAEDRTAYVTLE